MGANPDPCAVIDKGVEQPKVKTAVTRYPRGGGLLSPASGYVLEESWVAECRCLTATVVVWCTGFRVTEALARWRAGGRFRHRPSKISGWSSVDVQLRQ